MTFNKTRIWHGGLSELGLPDAPAPARLPDAPAPVVEPRISAEELAAFGRQASELVPTRFFPIDSLHAPDEVPAPAANVEAQVQTERTSRRARLALGQLGAQVQKLRGLPTGKIVVYGALAAAAVLVLAWPVDEAPAARRSAPLAVVPQAQQREEQQTPRQQHAPAPAPQGLERAAVDALVSGDYGGARARYAQLVAARPDNPVFAEAERILTRRLGSTQ